jgi:hypothetical protein
MVAEESNGNECVGQLGENVGSSGCWGKRWDVDEACVGRLDLCFVRELNSDAVLGWLLFGAWAVDLQEMACASCVSYGSLGWGLVMLLTFCANIVTTMTSSQWRSRPELSHDFGFVGCAASHDVLSGGFATMILCCESTRGAGVVLGYVVAMGPTVICVVVAAAVGRGVGRIGSVGAWAAVGA